MTLCTCGRELGFGKKDGQRKVCKCKKEWEFVHDQEIGNYWVERIKRVLSDKPEGYRMKAIRRRIAEAQGFGIFKHRRQT